MCRCLCRTQSCLQSWVFVETTLWEFTRGLSCTCFYLILTTALWALPQGNRFRPVRWWAQAPSAWEWLGRDVDPGLHGALDPMSQGHQKLWHTLSFCWQSGVHGEEQAFAGAAEWTQDWDRGPETQRKGDSLGYSAQRELWPGWHQQQAQYHQKGMESPVLLWSGRLLMKCEVGIWFPEQPSH